MGRLCFDMCLSVCPHLGRGYPSQVQVGGYPTSGTPIGPGQGVPQWGYPTLGTSRQTWLGGTPPQVPPPSDLAGWPLMGGNPTLDTLPIRPGQGVPRLGGYPTLGTPHRTWPEGYPTLGSTLYATVGMPLVFTPEDFLVLYFFEIFSALLCSA